MFLKANNESSCGQCGENISQWSLSRYYNSAFTVPNLLSNWKNRNFSFQNDYVPFKVHLLFIGWSLVWFLLFFFGVTLSWIENEEIAHKIWKISNCVSLRSFTSINYYLHWHSFINLIIFTKTFFLGLKKEKRPGSFIVSNFVHCIQLKLNFVLQLERSPSRNIWWACYCTNTNKM